MGCGIGVCVGCVIPTVRGMERVCMEGPVFAGNDVLWNEL
jgi:dihydroorotate dehydrogenase electron transfer subunit